MPFGFKQQTKGLGVFIGDQRSFFVARICAHPAGMKTQDVQVGIILKNIDLTKIASATYFQYIISHLIM